MRGARPLPLGSSSWISLLLFASPPVCSLLLTVDPLNLTHAAFLLARSCARGPARPVGGDADGRRRTERGRERERCTEKKEGQRGLPDQRERASCVSALYRAGLRPSLRPVSGSTSLREASRKGAFLTPDRVTPRIHQSGASSPTPLLSHSSEKQAEKSAPSKYLLLSLLAFSTVSNAETVVAWTVEDGVHQRG